MRLALALIVASCLASPAFAQFKNATDPAGPQLGRESVQRLRIGVVIKATGGALQNVVATAPVPGDWPEQAVKIVREDFSPSLGNVTYRNMTGGGRVAQMIVEVPFIRKGDEVHALVTFDVTRSTLTAPADTSVYRIPKKLDRELTTNVNASPFIETKHVKIAAAAKEAVAGKTNDWQKAEAIYEWVRANVKHKTGELKGAARALIDKEGDTDELVSLFVAMCRASKIPARTVFEIGHCYAEFYLEDSKGKGYWFPCQPAGAAQFGGNNDLRPILQKGDNFQDPEAAQERVRFVTEHFRAAGRGGEPNVRFVCEVVAE